MLRGEFAALSAALLWALSTVLFGRLGKTLTPLVLNLVKGVVAIGFITLTLLLQGHWQPELSGKAIVWLMMSGAIGIGLGDTAYFKALNYLGARRVLLLESLAPPLTALLARFLLEERLGLLAWSGIALTLSGVAWVISERVVSANVVVDGHLWQGTAWGLLAALGQASGAVMSRGALVHTAVDPLWSGLLRIIAGVLVLIILVGGRGQVRAQVKSLRLHQVLVGVVLAAFLGTYLAIWLQQVAFKYTPAGIAQALLATSPLFVLPIAILTGERVTGRACFGVLVAIAGIWLLIYGT